MDSTVLRLDIRSEKAAEAEDEELFFSCVRAGFGQRRKTLLNSLQTVKGVNREVAEESLKDAGIDAARRAETLSLEEFARISNQIRRRL